MKQSLRDKLNKLAIRLKELSNLLSDPEVTNNIEAVVEKVLNYLP